MYVKNHSASKSMANPRSLRRILGDPETTIILDGGLATELERKGCNISGALWSAKILLDDPESIKQVHLDYFNAGADVAITASYQASVAGLVQHHPSMTAKHAKQLIQQSVQLAKDAKSIAKSNRLSKELFVAGSVGPYGAYLADGSEYRGDYSLPEQEMKDFHRPRIEALVDAGVDVLAFETIPSYDEAVALLHLLPEYPHIDAWFSFTLRDDSHISDGTPLRKLVELLENSEQVLAIGVNCVPEAMAEGALATLHTLTSKPLVIYPNSGEIYDAETKTWRGEHSQGAPLKDKAQKWRTLGARLIGGCCRTTPDSIRTINDALR
jgi:homocysteine S-methyltransferase